MLCADSPTAAPAKASRRQGVKATAQAGFEVVNMSRYSQAGGGRWARGGQRLCGSCRSSGVGGVGGGAVLVQLQ